MKAETSLRYSIQETIENWFGSNSLEIKAIAVVRDPDHGNMTFAVGEFFPVAFSPEDDGARLSILYQLEIALVDERFENTEIIFDTDTTFRIV